MQLIYFSYLYIFDWDITKKQDFSDPKIIVNVNNVSNYEIKKDLKFVVIESKKAVFSS